jgi:hypothetical protein
MFGPSFLKALRVPVAAACACASATAFAALGASPMTGADPHVSTIDRATARAMTSATSASNGAYTVNEVTLDSGIVVREFVATSTRLVFAVSWTGPRLPNFRNLLGTYATRYLDPKAADHPSSTGLGQRALSADDLVVQSLGRLGRFSGYAYLPSAVPVGVAVSALQ